MKTAILTFFLGLGICLFSQASFAANDRATLSVLADESLTLPLTQIARRFSAVQHVSVTCNFAPPLQNLHKIDEGEPADLFLTAYSSLLEKLQKKGLADVYSLRSIAASRLQFVAAADTSAPKHFKGLKSILLASPTVNPEGQEAEHYLDALHGAPSPRYASSAALLRHMLLQEKTVGITYETDLKRLPGLQPLSLDDVPSLPVVTFKAVVVAGENMDKSRVFLDYLATREARDIFRRYGFITE